MTGEASFRGSIISEERGTQYESSMQSTIENIMCISLVRGEEENGVCVAKQIIRGDFDGDGNEDAFVSFRVMDDEEKGYLTGIIYNAGNLQNSTTMQLLRSAGTAADVQIQNADDLLGDSYFTAAYSLFTAPNSSFVKGDELPWVTIFTGDPDHDNDIDVMVRIEPKGCEPDTGCSQYTFFENTRSESAPPSPAEQ